MAKGACNCGAVAFEIDAPLADVYVCHCSICRRYSGAHGVAVVVVPNAAFRWVRGADQARHWDKPDAIGRRIFAAHVGPPCLAQMTPNGCLSPQG
jgi:hypothetical protein